MGKFIKIAIVVASLAYILYDLDFSLVAKSFKQYSLLELSPAIISMFVGIFVLSLRWRFITKNQITLKASLESSFLALGLNNILPAKMGEVAKVYYLKKIYMYDVSKALPMMIIERLFDVFILAIFILFTNSDYSAFVLVLISVISLYFLIKKAKVILKLLQKISHLKVRNFLKDNVKTISRITKSDFSIMLLYSILLWAIYYLTIYLFIQLATNFTLSATEILVVFIFSAIGMAIPSTPGGLGVVQAGCVIALSIYGIDKENALSFSIIYHMIQYIPTTIIALVIMYRSKFSF
jgi:uncharacterized protein (TIRG00374 family)